MVGNYKVITLCGSTRFKDAFMEAQKQLTLQGYIVISVGLFGHSGDEEVWENMDEGTLTQTKLMLDDMHKRKIDMADEIFVINVGDYIGDSTKSEINYAKTHGKRVNYLEPHKVMYEEPTAHLSVGEISENTPYGIDLSGGIELSGNRARVPKESEMGDKSHEESSLQNSQPEKSFSDSDSSSDSESQFDSGVSSDSDQNLSDLELLEKFMRSAVKGAEDRVYSPDDATAAILAYQNGEEDGQESEPEKNFGENSGKDPAKISGKESNHYSGSKGGENPEAVSPDSGSNLNQEHHEEGDAEFGMDVDALKKAYVLQMLHDGYDIPNTAYFLNMDEDEVRRIAEEN